MISFGDSLVKYKGENGILIAFSSFTLDKCFHPELSDLFQFGVPTYSDKALP